MTRNQMEDSLCRRFGDWLGNLSDEQITALGEHWENIINDAALDRVDSWIITENTIDILRKADEAVTRIEKRNT